MHGTRELCLGGRESGNIWDRNYLDRMYDTCIVLDCGWGLEISKNGSLRYHHWRGFAQRSHIHRMAIALGFTYV